MIIAISGSVGSGKTSFSKFLQSKLNEKFEKETFTVLKERKYDLIHLNEKAVNYKVEDVKELQTFDFDIDKLVADFNNFLKENRNKNLIIEGHFAHFLNPELIDFLFVINRDLKELRETYTQRSYNEQKIKDNLEVESFNLCFYEALEEGFEEEKQVFCIDNNSNFDDLYKTVSNLIEK